MAWSTHPTVVTGQTWTASDHNTYVKGNLDTLFPYTAANQIAFSTSTTTLSKATQASAFQFLRPSTDGTTMDFGSLIYYRQGNSSADWYTTSTSTTQTNYTPTRAIFQCGDVYMSTTTVNITFPITYTTKPVIFVNAVGSAFYTAYAIPSTTGAAITANTSGVAVVWFAVGE